LSRGRSPNLFYPDHTRSLQDHFAINLTSTRPNRSLSDCFSHTWLLNHYLTFLTVKNYRVGGPTDANHFEHSCQVVPDHFTGLGRVDLIGSGNTALTSPIFLVLH